MKKMLWLGCLLSLVAACNTYQEGKQYLDGGEYEKAAIYYKKQIEQNPDNAYLHNQLGFSYARLNMHREADQNYRKALELKPDYFEAQLNLGTVLMKLRRHKAAQEELKRALELKPDNLAANVNLAFACLYADDLEQAEKLFIKIRGMSKDDFQYEQTLKDLQKEMARRQEEQAAKASAPGATDGATAPAEAGTTGEMAGASPGK